MRPLLFLAAFLTATPALARPLTFGAGARWSSVFTPWTFYDYWSYYSPVSMMCAGGDAYVAFSGPRIGVEGDWCASVYYNSNEQQSWYVGGNIGYDIPLETSFIGARVGVGYGEYDSYPGRDRFHMDYVYVRPAAHYTLPMGFVAFEVGAYLMINIPTYQRSGNDVVNWGTFVTPGFNFTIYFGNFSTSTRQGLRASLPSAPPVMTPSAPTPPQPPPAPAAPTPPKTPSGETPLAIPATGSSASNPTAVSGSSDMVPSGTPLLVRFLDAVDGSRSVSGTRVAVSLEGNLRGVDGSVVIADQSRGYGTLFVTEYQGQNYLAVSISEFRTQSGDLIRLNTDAALIAPAKAGSSGSGAAGGAVIGAIIGGIITGRPGGAAFGGAMGAAAGASSSTPPTPAGRINANTIVEFHLSQPL